jgi:hypothetical protein
LYASDAHPNTVLYFMSRAWKADHTSLFIQVTTPGILKGASDRIQWDAFFLVKNVDGLQDKKLFLTAV